MGECLSAKKWEMKWEKLGCEIEKGFQYKCPLSAFIETIWIFSQTLIKAVIRKPMSNLKY